MVCYLMLQILTRADEGGGGRKIPKDHPLPLDSNHRHASSMGNCHVGILCKILCAWLFSTSLQNLYRVQDISDFQKPSCCWTNWIGFYNHCLTMNRENVKSLLPITCLLLSALVIANQVILLDIESNGLYYILYTLLYNIAAKEWKVV